MAQTPTRSSRRSFGVAVAFFAVSASFMALGANGRAGMFGVGAAFMAVGFAFLFQGLRAKKAERSSGEGMS